MTTSSSSPFIRMGGLDGPAKSPALGDAPAEPGRPSILPIVLGGLEGPPRPPDGGSEAPRQSRGAPRNARVHPSVAEARALSERAMRGGGYEAAEARILADHAIDAGPCRSPDSRLPN